MNLHILESYSQIKMVHVAAVLASGVLFLVRGAASVAGARWVMAAPLRYASYAIDTLLLVAAIALAVLSRQYPLVQSWLTVKVVLLAVYIVLGSYALKRGRTPRVRLGCWVAALAVYAFIISVAHFHHPLGAFAGLFH